MSKPIPEYVVPRVQPEGLPSVCLVHRAMRTTATLIREGYGPRKAADLVAKSPEFCGVDRENGRAIALLNGAWLRVAIEKALGL